MFKIFTRQPQFPFDGRQVRVLLYREYDGRRLLFDSNALEKVLLKTGKRNITKEKHHTESNPNSNSLANCGANNNKHSNNKHSSNVGGKSTSAFIEVCDEYGFRHNRPTSDDIMNIGEMVFGASAMSFRGTAFKIHWLQSPARILCSQVFLTPIHSSSSGGPSPYSTISMNSLTTPRTSISSEHGSIDGLSMNSFSMPCSVNVGRHLSLTPSERSSGTTATTATTSPLDMPDQQSIISANSNDSVRVDDSGPRSSSTYSTVTDSGYSGMSRSQLSSDQWSVSYQYSARSSAGSVLSENNDSLRKLSIDSTFFPCSQSTQLDSVASDGSLQRRIHRNLHTSFENEHSTNDLIGFVSDQYPTGTSSSRPNGGGSEGGGIGMPNYRRASYCANESRSNPEIGKRRDGITNATNTKHNTRRAKLGLVVLITMSESFEEEMELFCSEHIALLESMLSRLRVFTEKAYLNYKDFYQIMFQSWQTTQQWFSDIFTAPRIKCPVWLSITTSGSKYSKSVAESFIKEFCWLLSFADTKDTNFFISTMLTAILTHHLGWVSTVSAFNSSTTLSEASAVAIEQRAKLQQVSQKHPYNALWAQLGDLYGAIGMPPKLARTVIYGTEKLSVERLLKILTYFIRCGEVRRTAKREDFNKGLVNSIVSQNKNEILKKSSNTKRMGLKKSHGIGHGMTRTQTCKQNLNTITDSFNETGSNNNGSNCSSSSGNSNSNSGSEESIDEIAFVQNAKKNEIPNVLAFRDSRFVQQELRIGNYLMDTGIEKSSVVRNNSVSGIVNANPMASINLKDERIRFTVTTPDNIEMHFEEDISNAPNCNVGSPNSVDGALEAIEIDDRNEIDLKTIEGTVRKRKSSFLWNIVPQSVKDGLSLKSHGKILPKDCEKRICNLENVVNTKRTDSNGHIEKCSSHLSLSDLITQNSMGKSDRMTWGIEPIKENVSLEEQIHFDYSQKIIEKEHGISRHSGSEIKKNPTNTDSNCDQSLGVGGGGDSGNGNKSKNGVSNNNGGVVFVLGDNEPLINIKKSTEDLLATAVSELTLNPLQSNLNEDKIDGQDQQKLCSLHIHTYGKGAARQLSTTQNAPVTVNSTANNTIHSKKHSGVKFNFQEYPQIATNYMKSKNLVLSNYDLLMEKCSKLEAAEATAISTAQKNQNDIKRNFSIDAGNISLSNEILNQSKKAITTTTTTEKTTTIITKENASTTSISSATCIVCNSLLNSYQTPSNATELEFETDEEHSYSTTVTTTTNTATNVNNNSTERTLNTISSAASIETIKSANNPNNDCIGINISLKIHDQQQYAKSLNEKIENEEENRPQEDEDDDNNKCSNIDKINVNSTAQPIVLRRPAYSSTAKKVSSQRGVVSSVASKCAAVNHAVHLLKLPIPGIKELPQDEDPLDNMKLRAGFIPSLFLNVSDHYVSDVVLQGTFASPNKWETSLREDLALSARSASLISLPVENIAIIADMENWDVRLLSSQTAQCFPYAGGQSAPVGMSQLVSSMLEAVQAMNSSGISAYECLSFLESKLQEIYLQSETLAAFLLETDFCSLSAVTGALNLTENDVPLLLSIASIHTPQISKKCGISFR